MKLLINTLLLNLILFYFQTKEDKTNFGLFEYEQVESRNKGFKSHVTFFELNSTKNFSTYTQIFKQELEEKYTQENEEGINNIIIVKPKKDEMKIVYNNFDKNSTFFKEITAFDKVYVKEENYEIKWDLIEESKKFGKRVCKKARTYFRGRTYIAWYSPEIKTNVGPWKFKNPPGLIFEIYDEKDVLNIKLIRFNTKKQSNINIWNLEKIKKIINLDEYKTLKNKEEDVILERLNSKLPKGAKPFVKNKEQKEIEIFK